MNKIFISFYLRSRLALRFVYSEIKISIGLFFTRINKERCLRLNKVLYMSFDKFLLAVESRDLSQANKSIIRVSSFPKLSDG